MFCRYGGDRYQDERRGFGRQDEERPLYGRPNEAQSPFGRQTEERPAFERPPADEQPPPPPPPPRQQPWEPEPAGSLIRERERSLLATDRDAECAPLDEPPAADERSVQPRREFGRCAEPPPPPRDADRWRGGGALQPPANGCPLPRPTLADVPDEQPHRPGGGFDRRVPDERPPPRGYDDRRQLEDRPRRGWDNEPRRSLRYDDVRGPPPRAGPGGGGGFDGPPNRRPFGGGVGGHYDGTPGRSRLTDGPPRSALISGPPPPAGRSALVGGPPGPRQPGLPQFADEERLPLLSALAGPPADALSASERHPASAGAAEAGVRGVDATAPLAREPARPASQPTLQAADLPAAAALALAVQRHQPPSHEEPMDDSAAFMAELDRIAAEKEDVSSVEESIRS